jgi:hypothetical protein
VGCGPKKSATGIPAFVCQTGKLPCHFDRC